MITFEVPGPPQPMQRARSRFVQPKGRPGFTTTYTPGASRSWKTSCQDRMVASTPPDFRPYPAGTPLRLILACLFPCPAGDHRKGRVLGRRWHTKAQGDADNLAKAVMDAGNTVLWEDDRQIAELQVVKLVAAQGEMPKVVATVTILDPLDDRAAPRELPGQPAFL